MKLLDNFHIPILNAMTSFSICRILESSLEAFNENNPVAPLWNDVLNGCANPIHSEVSGEVLE